MTLTVEIYERFSTTMRPDPGRELRAAVIEPFTTFFPGGLYGTAGLFIPREATRAFHWRGGDRLVIRSGQMVVWEGEITRIGYVIGSEAQQGLKIEAVGYWGALLARRSINKVWADTRIDTAVWRVDATLSGAELGGDDRKARIRITPKAEDWSSGDVYGIEYTMPTGQTVKRVTLDYDLDEGGQAWELRLRDTAGAADIWSVSSTGTGSRDDTLGTPRQSLQLQLVAGANQTAKADGTYYGEVTSVVVYGETGSINLTEIAKDIIGLVSELSSDETYIGSNGLSLVPFMTAGFESAANVLARAASFGDSSYNPWYAAVLDSEQAASSDGSPVLKVAQYPALTDYDYVVRVDDPNVAAPVDIDWDFDAIRNWVTVVYRDQENDRDITVSPDDDANLKDTDSIALYGERHLEQSLRAEVSTLAGAKNLARRYLDENRLPRISASGPIKVTGRIRTKNGSDVPVEQVTAGKRIRIEQFVNDVIFDNGLTFIITQTEYNPETRTCSITTGLPDALDVYLAQLSQAAKAAV